MKPTKANGYGPGYCYWSGRRAILAVAEDEATIRLMVVPSARVRSIRPFSTTRKLFVLQRT